MEQMGEREDDTQLYKKKGQRITEEGTWIARVAFVPKSVGVKVYIGPAEIACLAGQLPRRRGYTLFHESENGF